MRTRRTVTVLTAVSAAALLSPLVAPGVAGAADPYKITAVIGTFHTDHRSGKAVTYEPELVPVGAIAGVSSVRTDSGTVTELEVRGLVADREYGAHVHVSPCGETGDDAGPHYQHERDPNQPSTDPAYANPGNEVWLDFTTDAEGKGAARSEVGWAYGEHRPASVVIHEHGTATEDGAAGTAGARLACVNVPF